MRDASPLEVQPVSGALGAVVTGLDLRVAGAREWGLVSEAFLEHLVLFFPDQSLSPLELTEVAGGFGDPTQYPFIEGLPDAPYVIPIVKEADERKNFGEGWHSDTTYTATPPMATALYALEVPAVGGDTLFANMYRACEMLSDGMRERLMSLRAVNSSLKRRGGGRSAGNRFQSVKFKNRERVLEGIHPILRRHPRTGRRALYVNELHTTRIESLTEEESAPILGYLYAHKRRAEFTCRFRWSAGTLAVWDNRCVQHYALNDYHGHRRAMLRVSIAGERPE